MVGKIVSNSRQIIRGRWTDFTNLINLDFGQSYFSNHWIFDWNYNSMRNVAYHSKHFKRKLWCFSFFYVLFDYFYEFSYLKVKCANVGSFPSKVYIFTMKLFSCVQKMSVLPFHFSFFLKRCWRIKETWKFLYFITRGGGHSFGATL